MFYEFQEGLLLLLDVGPSMHGVLPQVEKLCSMLVQKKVLMLFSLGIVWLSMILCVEKVVGWFVWKC